MPNINTPINGHSELATFTWALNLLAQPRTGEGFRRLPQGKGQSIIRCLWMLSGLC